MTGVQTCALPIYIKYIQWLSNAILDSDAVILVKIHPSEKIQQYNQVSNFENLKIVTLPISSLFKISLVHISIYSTTLYEALNYEILNFSLDADEMFRSYVDTIVNDKIAFRLAMDQNPLDIISQVSRNELMQSNELYSDFNFKNLDEILKW